MVAIRLPFPGQSIPAYANTVGRGVHVKIHPQPRNLAESREVLRVLQQYGEVIMYKHLKHEPDVDGSNLAVAVYKSAHSAQDILNASPLRFESGRVESSSSVSHLMPSTPPSAEEEEPNEAPGGGTTFTGLNGMARWGQMRSSPSTEEAATSPSPSQPPKSLTPNPTPLKASTTDLPNPLSSTQQSSTSSYTPHEIHLSIHRSSMNHQAYIQRQHYYGRFQLDLNSHMGEDLEKRVPVAGMADCQLGKPHVPTRIRTIRRQETERTGWMSLGDLWKEGERAREREANEKVGINDGVDKGDYDTQIDEVIVEAWGLKTKGNFPTCTKHGFSDLCPPGIP